MLKKAKLRMMSSWVLLAIILSIIGFLWVAHLSESRAQNLLPEDLEGLRLVVQGTVDSLPQDSESGRRFTLNVHAWENLPKSGIEKDKLPHRISLGWYAPRPFFFSSGESHKLDLSKIPELIPGQVWRLPVVLKRPRGLSNPHTFDYERWAYMQDLGANGHVHDKSHAKLLAWDWKNFKALVDLLRWKIRDKIKKSLPEESRYLGVLIALVIGDQNAIHQEDWQMFNATGIGHLIAISGMHITMLAALGAWLGRRLWRKSTWVQFIPAPKVAVLVGFLTALIYTWIAGFQIPAQRTMVMVGVSALALWSGRIVRGFDLWWWALFIVMFIHPWAIYTPGFWLSFGAVAIILFAMPAQQNQQNDQALNIPDVDHVYLQSIRESFSQACRVQAVVTIALIPLTLFWFFQISLVSPLSNAFAIPVISWLVTPLAMMGAFIPNPIGAWLLLLAHWILDYLLILLHKMASWDWSVLTAPKPSWWMFLIAMAGVLVCARPGSILESWKSRLLGLSVCLTLFFAFPHGISRGDFQAIAWDIGQGTAVLIRTKNHALLYDTGPMSGSSNDPGQRVILPYLRAQGIRKIDRLAISHKDADHIGGVSSLLQGIRIDEIRGSIPQSHSLQDEFKLAGVKALPCKAGDQWHWDGVDFVVWHPGPEVTFEDHFHQGKPNEMSCVIEVRNQHYSFWLTGDVEKHGEAEILERFENLGFQDMMRTRKQVFMAPHHGSKTSSTHPFLEWIQPDWAFAQTGYQNRYRHPSREVIARYESRGLKLLNTSDTGALLWKFEGKNLQFRSWRDANRRIWHR
jgi:competence protein ComEC